MLFGISETDSTQIEKVSPFYVVDQIIPRKPTAVPHFPRHVRAPEAECLRVESVRRKLKEAVVDEVPRNGGMENHQRRRLKGVLVPEANAALFAPVDRQSCAKVTWAQADRCALTYP